MHKNLTVAERLNLNSSLGLKQFELGSVVAKGNNAVVYEARKIEVDIGKFRFYITLKSSIVYYFIVINIVTYFQDRINHFVIY